MGRFSLVACCAALLIPVGTPGCAGSGSGGGGADGDAVMSDLPTDEGNGDSDLVDTVDSPDLEPDSDGGSDGPDGFVLPDISWNFDIPEPDDADHLGDTAKDVISDGSDGDASDAKEPPDMGPEDVDVPVDAAPDVDETDVPVDPPYDCSTTPQGPFGLVKLQGPMASEDLAFDPYGHVIGSNDQAIFKSEYQSPPQVFVPNLKFRAGLRYLPSGHLVVCNDKKGQLVRIDETGVQHVVLTGLSYPNGLTVDMAGWVYVTEHDADKVLRVNPYSGEHTVLTTEIHNPNGITFSPDYKTLYIDGFSGAKIIYAMSISPDGVPGKLIKWATNVGTGWLDGMGVDICGNVYVADYGKTVIYRISPDGKTKTKIIDAGGISGAYLPNMDWGSGVGGWDTHKLYLPDGWNKGVFEVDIGIPSKPVPYP